MPNLAGEMRPAPLRLSAVSMVTPPGGRYRKSSTVESAFERMPLSLAQDQFLVVGQAHVHALEQLGGIG